MPRTTADPIDASRLTLEPYQDVDWPELTEWLSDRRLLLSLYPQSLKPADRHRVMADWRSAPPGLQDFQRVVRLDDQRVVGCVRLQRRQLSYFLGRPYWGRGLGRRMLGLVTAELRDTRPGESVEALVARDNIASCRILQQNGFSFSGIVAGPTRWHCWQAFTWRAEPPAAAALPAALPAEEPEQSVVDGR